MAVQLCFYGNFELYCVMILYVFFVNALVLVVLCQFYELFNGNG